MIQAQDNGRMDDAAPGETAGWLTGWPMVGIFLVLYVFSFVDRTIINMMVEPLERDLGVSDFQISLLMGPAFGLFYVLCGLPMGLLIDRFSKRWITAASVAVWGAATCLCGVAGNFAQLAIGRMGVGVGESALTPSAHSMISEQFPRRRLSTALAVFSLGAVIGSGLAITVGGAAVHMATDMGNVRFPIMGEVRPWQVVFLAVGLPTILLAPIALALRERRRGPAEHATRDAAVGVISGEPPLTFRDLMRRHWQLFIGLPVGFGLLNVITNSYAAWIPTFMVREFGWNVGQVGLAWGTQHIIAGAVGQIGGAMIVDRLYARGMSDAHVKYQIFGLLVAIPLNVVAFLSGNPWIFLALNAFYYVLCFPFLGYAAAALQLYTPSHLRGRVSAVFLAVVTTIGTGIGATATGALTDFVFQDKAKLGLSLVTITVIFTPLILLVLVMVAKKMRAMHTEAAAEESLDVPPLAHLEEVSS